MIVKQALKRFLAKCSTKLMLLLSRIINWSSFCQSSSFLQHFYAAFVVPTHCAHTFGHHQISPAFRVATERRRYPALNKDPSEGRPSLAMRSPVRLKTVPQPRQEAGRPAAATWCMPARTAATTPSAVSRSSHSSRTVLAAPPSPSPEPPEMPRPSPAPSAHAVASAPTYLRLCVCDSVCVCVCVCVCDCVCVCKDVIYIYIYMRT
jgi:hypothetical protein